MAISIIETKNKSSIIHINTHDIAGGAAKVAWRLAEAQRNAGHVSRMLVGIKTDDSVNSFSFPIDADPSIQAQCQREGQLFYEFQGSHKLINNPLVRSADLLHLHNLHGGYFNPFSISALSHLKPLVWTLHDMQAFTGHCAHSFDCERWQDGCGECPYLNVEPAIQVDTSAQLLKDKKLIYDHSYLSIVTPSQWLKNKVERSILQNHPVELIHNGIDTNIFQPYNKKEVRKKFGIPEDVLVIGAVGHGGTLANQWKGGKYTQAALDALWKNSPDYIFVNIGSNYKTDDPRIFSIPHANNETELAQAYSTLDIFLYTPIADNCPLVVLEALSCGIPIVTFNTGGVPELVRDGLYGYVTEYKNIMEIVQAVERLAANPELCIEFSRNARERVISKFDQNIIVPQYERLYERSIEEHKTNSNRVKLLPLSEVPEIVMSQSLIEAENSKDRAKNQMSDSQDIFINEAESKIQTGNHLEAKTILSNLINRFPNHINALNDLAIVEILENNFESAHKFLEKVLSIDTGNEIATENLNHLNQIQPSNSISVGSDSSIELDVSIVIATKNRAQLLDEMLASLKDAVHCVNYEIIVIEGNSTDNTLEVLQRHGVNQIYDEAGCLGEGKHSWPQLYNFGFSKARGKWAMYASDDIIFNRGCISKAVELLNKLNSEVAGGIFFYKNINADPGWDTFGIDFTYGQKLLMNYGLLRLDG